MSTERYMAAIRCENPHVVPHQVWLIHPPFVQDATGVDPFDEPLTAALRFYKRFDVDNGGPFALNNTPKPRPQQAADTDGTRHTDEGFNTTWGVGAPFTEPEQLWDFDPQGPEATKAQEPAYAVANFHWVYDESSWPQRRQEFIDMWVSLDTHYPGRFTRAEGFYCTAFMWAVCVFGWDVFLTALGLDPDRTGQTIQRIADVTARMYRYFATVPGCRFVAAHDDLCIGTGPVASPQWYRKWIYPTYEKIFEPVRQAGMPVVLTSDGDITKLAPDLADIFDGFVFESSTPADYMFDNFGHNKALIGGINVHPLTFGDEHAVRHEVARALERGKRCPGYIAACADTIPANVPIPNVYAYFDAIQEHRVR